MYLVMESREAALALSRRLYQLRRPNPAKGDKTLYWCGVIDHPDGRAALDMADDTAAKIDPQASAEALMDGMERKDVTAIRAKRGSRAKLSEILPRGVDRATLEADGWFQE